MARPRVSDGRDEHAVAPGREHRTTRPLSAARGRHLHARGGPSADRGTQFLPARPADPLRRQSHHTFKPGTVTVESETFRRYVRDVCTSAGEWGIENVLLVNGHYLVQDPELEIVVRDLRIESGIRASHVPLMALFEDVAREIRESELSFHASEFETSVLSAVTV